MADETFNVGDVVQLKSGGPEMTVGIITGEVIRCVWFDAKQEPQQRDFSVHLLEKVNRGYA